MQTQYKIKYLKYKIKYLKYKIKYLEFELRYLKYKIKYLQQNACHLSVGFKIRYLRVMRPTQNLLHSFMLMVKVLFYSVGTWEMKSQLDASII